MALSDIKKAEILKLTAEGKTTSEVAKMVGCDETQVSYVKKCNPQKDIVMSVIVEGPKWGRWVGHYFRVRCQTGGGLTVTVCRVETDGNRRTQDARKGEMQKLVAVLIGREIEFSTRMEPEGHRLDYHAKYARLPEELKVLVPDSTFSRIHSRHYDPDDPILEGAFTDDERQCFTRSERVAILGIGR